MYGNPSIIMGRKKLGDDGMKEQTCCFTGHRTIPTDKMQEIIGKTEAKVRELISEGYRCFIVGGAVGYDTIAAELLFRLRDGEHLDIRVILAYPFDGYTGPWSEEQKATYARLLPLYDERICVAAAATRGRSTHSGRYGSISQTARQCWPVSAPRSSFPVECIFPWQFLPSNGDCANQLIHAVEKPAGTLAALIAPELQL